MWYKLFSHITLDTDAPFRSPRLFLLLSQGAVGLLTQMRHGVWSQWGAFILLLLFKHCWTWFWSGVRQRKATLTWFWAGFLVLNDWYFSHRAELDVWTFLNWAVSLVYAANQTSVYILVYCTFTWMCVYCVCLGSDLWVNWRKSQSCCSWE